MDGVWGSIFSFRERPVPVETAAALSLPHHHQLRQTAAAYRHAIPGAFHRAGTSRRSLASPQGADASPAHRLRQHGAQSSVPFRDGRRAKCPREFRRGAGAVGFSGAAIAKNLVGPENGRAAAAAVGAGRAGQPRRPAARQGAGESELHRVGGNPRLLYPAVRHQDRRHLESVSRQGSSSNCPAKRFCWKTCRCFGRVPA